MYAVVEIKGKQYKAEKGGLLEVDLFDKEPGTAVEFDSVVLLSGGQKVKVGQPFVAGAKVKAKVEKHIKADKVLVLKFKRRKGYQKLQGHRQNYTVLKVEDVTGF